MVDFLIKAVWNMAIRIIPGLSPIQATHSFTPCRTVAVSLGQVGDPSDRPAVGSGDSSFHSDSDHPLPRNSSSRKVPMISLVPVPAQAHQRHSTQQVPLPTPRLFFSPTTPAKRAQCPRRSCFCSHELRIEPNPGPRSATGRKG